MFTQSPCVHPCLIYIRFNLWLAAIFAAIFVKMAPCWVAQQKIICPVVWKSWAWIPVMPPPTMGPEPRELSGRERRRNSIFFPRSFTATLAILGHLCTPECGRAKIMLSSNCVTLLCGAALNNVSLRKHLGSITSPVGSCHLMGRAGWWEVIGMWKMDRGEKR